MADSQQEDILNREQDILGAGPVHAFETNELPRNNTHAQEELGTTEETRHRSRAQPWTNTGYPIVDNKYYDLSTGTTKTLQGDEHTRAGPPTLEVHWYNRNTNGQRDQFRSVVFSATVEMTEYLRRIGEFLSLGNCTVMALNATKYSVNVVVSTEMTHDEMMNDCFKKCNLFPARKLPSDPVYPTAESS